MDFINRADEDRCIKYMIKIMRDKKAASRKWKSKDNQILALEEALRILKNRKMINSERGDESPKWRPNGRNGKDSLVRHCIIGLSGVDPLTKTKVDSENDIVDTFFDSQEHFTWGEWRLEQAHQLKDRNGKPIGYSDVLKSAITPIGGGCLNPLLRVSPSTHQMATDQNKAEENRVLHREGCCLRDRCCLLGPLSTR